MAQGEVAFSEGEAPLSVTALALFASMGGYKSERESK
jgi:hypothetical protein